MEKNYYGGVKLKIISNALNRQTGKPNEPSKGA
jgi:hypothetical protein